MARQYDEVDVLLWLPGQTEAVVAGQALCDGGATSFRYERAYLARPDAIAIFDGDLPLGPVRFHPPGSHALAPSLRDALPDRWGRRAIAAGLSRPGIELVDEDQVDDITLMLRSGPDRIGALDFRRPGHAEDDAGQDAALEDLMRLADLVECGAPLPPEMRPVLRHCASVGGARPKALFTDAGGCRMIAKFSAEADPYPVVCGEFIAMRLADLAGIDVAAVKLAKVGERDVLLVERFDRLRLPEGGWGRRAMVSALTWVQEDELSAHHISYAQLAAVIEERFEDPEAAKEEMFARLVFNILVGNTDDHARNHAAFCDGRRLVLTPAYDIAPQRRMSREANQAMVLAAGSRAAQLRNAVAIAPAFGVTGPMFRHLLDRLVGAITDHWSDVCDESGLTRAEREAFAGRQFLNGYAFEGHGRAPCLR